MDDAKRSALEPAFARYQEWIGFNSHAQQPTIDRAAASLKEQGADVEDVVQVVLYFRDKHHGYLFMAVAPLKSSSEILEEENDVNYKTVLLLAWTHIAFLLWGFGLSRQEYCGTPDVFPLAYLGWPLAVAALSLGDEVEVAPCMPQP